MDCLICMYDSIQIITCKSCSYRSCGKCLAMYFESVSEPKCPNCNVIWSRDFILSDFPNYYDDYVKKKERRLLEIEMAKMPSTQVYVEQEKEARTMIANLKETFDLVDKWRAKFYRLQEAQTNIDRILSSAKPSINQKYDRVRKQLRKKVSEMNQKAFRSNEAMIVFDANTHVSRLRDFTKLTKTTSQQTMARQITGKCPIGECRGYIYSDMKCGVCGKSVCDLCFTEKDENHHCKDDDVLSRELIKTETKPCPTCTAPIFKINGCSQMWCTICHTTFSWITGQEDDDLITHNPHYYEWVRRQNNGVVPRARGDMIPQRSQVLKYYEDMSLLKEGPEKEKIRHFYRFTTYSKPDFPMPPENDNKLLRVQYLLGELAEGDMARVVYDRDFERSEKVEISQVFDMFFKESAGIQKSTNMTGFIDKLVEYVNQQLEMISKKYKTNKIEILYDEMGIGYEIRYT